MNVQVFYLIPIDVVNCSCYIFGRFNGRYTQYPADSAKSIFENCVKYCSKVSQLVIHRENRITYYTYIRKLDNKVPSYVGISVLFSELRTSKIDLVTQILEDAVNGMAAAGDILDYSRNGIVSTTNNLSKKGSEVNFLFRNIQKSLDSLNGYLEKLPSVNYAVDRDTYNVCKLTDDKQTIMRKSNEYGYLIAVKDETIKNEWSEISEILGEYETEKQNAVGVFVKTMSTKDKIIVILICIVLLLILVLIFK